MLHLSTKSLLAARERFFLGAQSLQNTNGLSRRNTQTWSALAVSVAFLTIGCVGQAAATPRLTPEQTARIQDICLNTMRMQRGEVHFDTCVSVLSTTFAQQLEGHTMNANRAGCEQAGLHPGSTEFDVCVANLENRDDSRKDNTVQAVNTASDAALLPSDPASTSPNDDKYPSDTSSPPMIRFARARVSCAELGLDPQSSAFGNCVADLDVALFELDHEPN
jgi:hypothetical protein